MYVEPAPSSIFEYITAFRPSRQLRLSRNGKTRTLRWIAVLNQYAYSISHSFAAFRTNTTASVFRNGKGALLGGYPLNQHKLCIYFINKTAAFRTNRQLRLPAAANETAKVHLSKTWISSVKQRVYVTVLRPSQQFWIIRTANIRLVSCKCM